MHHQARITRIYTGIIKSIVARAATSAVSTEFDSEQPESWTGAELCFVDHRYMLAS